MHIIAGKCIRAGRLRTEDSQKASDCVKSRFLISKSEGQRQLLFFVGRFLCLWKRYIGRELILSREKMQVHVENEIYKSTRRILNHRNWSMLCPEIITN